MNVIIFLVLIAYIYLSIRYWVFRLPLQPQEDKEITISQTKKWKNDFLVNYFDASPYVCTEGNEENIEEEKKSLSLRWEYLNGEIISDIKDALNESKQKRIGNAWTVYIGLSGTSTIRVYFSSTKFTDILLREGTSVFLPKKTLFWEIILEENCKIKPVVIYDYLLLAAFV